MPSNREAIYQNRFVIFSELSERYLWKAPPHQNQVPQFCVPADGLLASWVCHRQALLPEEVLYQCHVSRVDDEQVKVELVHIID